MIVGREAEEAKQLYFNPEEVFHANQTVPGWGDEDDDDDEDDDRGLFEKMVAKMTDLTEDGGVYKKVLKEGTGSVVPIGAFVTGITALLKINIIHAVWLVAMQCLHSCRMWMFNLHTFGWLFNSASN